MKREEHEAEILTECEILTPATSGCDSSFVCTMVRRREDMMGENKPEDKGGRSEGTSEILRRACGMRRWERRKLARDGDETGEITKGGWVEQGEERGSEREREQCQERYKCEKHQTPSQSRRQAIFSLLYYIIFDFSERVL